MKIICNVLFKLCGNDFLVEFEVCGEVFMDSVGFVKFNSEVEKCGEKVFVNLCNVVVGSLC